jgi:beta-galactosidase
VTAAEASWAPQGFEIAAAQLAVGSGAGSAAGSAESPAARVSGSPSATTSAGAAASAPDEATVTLDADGLLVHELLAAAPTLSLWRAPTDNDRFGGIAAGWTAAGLDRLERRLVSIERGADAADVVSEYRTPAGLAIRHEQTFRAMPDGAIRVDEVAVIPDELTDVPRVGTVVEVVAGLEQAEWFGAGPHETYPDRRRAGLVARWKATVDELYTPYVRPQENGGRADVRWLELSDGRGRGLRITADEPRQVSASHYRAADLAAATHDVELTARAETVVHLDAAHRGLGTASCGPDTLPEYLVGPGTYRWSWTLGPSSAG